MLVCIAGRPIVALCRVSQSTKRCISRFRHIQAGKRENIGSRRGTAGRLRTARSTIAVSGQSASSATMLKPARAISAWVMRARIA